MSSINKNMSIEEFAIHVASELKKEGINVVLVGGAVVSIYTKNKYESHDLDFLSLTEHKEIRNVMIKMGFKEKGKNFLHPNTDFTVEFPGYELSIGNSPMKPEGEITKKNFTLKLLSPSQCVMDRLAAYYHWDDRQSLEQALLVAQEQPIQIEKIKKWSVAEGSLEKFQIFLTKLKR